MRGQKEQKCLDFVKNNIKFEKYYGFSQEDVKEFELCLKSAVPNENSNDFPDFVCDNGFIEHFQISSGENTKKGSKHLATMNTYLGNNQKEVISKMEKGDFSIYTTSMNCPVHKYEYLIKSLESSWNSHIDSFNKYDGNKTIGIFMVEYQDSFITMCENIYANVKSGVSCGDIKNQNKLDYYSMCRDKKALNFIYGYKDKIKYVIYVCDKCVEIINITNIPEILKMLPFDYCIAAMLSVIRTDTYIPVLNNED